ncbi:MAG: hypothetical protein BAA04_08195 [Firmicutes bacterium ZCTH02-B6]|nr:MAG: hypothetical protein BAA04_08195 [Firmicutes bacterium ZCTH02-B6]
MAVETNAAPAPAGHSPAVTWRDRWQTFRLSAWLGWQVESNWADPLLFAVYSMAKPIASALILVIMYRIIANETAEALFPGMYVGNALFMYVGALMFGVSWVIMEEREYFQILKYIYLSTASMYWYLAGRAVAKFLITTLAVVILLAFGAAFLDLPLRLSQVDWGLFATVFPLGILTMIGLGYLLAGVLLISARHGSGYVESVAGALYLLCGVVFPLDVLPGWLAAAGKVIPVTYWLEGLRRALLGQSFAQALAGYSDGQIVLWLAISTVVTLGVSVWFFGRMDHVARSRGLIDQVTEH